MSKYVLKPRVKPAETPSVIGNKYWRRAIARARANYHRGEDHRFSANAIANAHRLDTTVQAIAADLGVEPINIYTQGMKVWHDKFIVHTAVADNPFAAYHCFAQMEREAKAALEVQAATYTVF